MDGWIGDGFAGETMPEIVVVEGKEDSSCEGSVVLLLLIIR